MKRSELIQKLLEAAPENEDPEVLAYDNDLGDYDELAIVKKPNHIVIGAACAFEWILVTDITNR